MGTASPPAATSPFAASASPSDRVRVLTWLRCRLEPTRYARHAWCDSLACERRREEATTSGSVASTEVFEDIMRTLQSSFVFTGICTAVLTRMVHRMRRVEFGPGDTIVQQGDQATSSDCLYYVEVRPARAAANAANLNFARFRLHKQEQQQRTGVFRAPPPPSPPPPPPPPLVLQPSATCVCLSGPATALRRLCAPAPV